MKVLFVCSGNSKNFDIVPFIKAQGESLKRAGAGVEVNYFPIKGKGISGYLKAGLKLRKYLGQNPHDIIHAHFTLSGWSAVIGSGNVPVVLSLMGTDAQGDYVGYNRVRFRSRFYMLLTRLIQPFVGAVISKSKSIARHVHAKHKSYIVPNGIDTSLFKAHATGFRQELGLREDRKYVLFLGDRGKAVKNYALAKKAVEHLNMPDVELINPYPLPHAAIPLYLNSVNLLVLPSFMEGSPNVIKEAMACNCPIVATDVGDVRWVFGNTAGCYISSFEVAEFAENIRAAIAFSDQYGRTKGELRIQELNLSSEKIASQLLDVYRTVTDQPVSGEEIQLRESLSIEN